MEQHFSTSKVTVEYFDPHGLYKLLSPGLASRLPLRHLHWQSHSGPLRSIDTLHVELISASSNAPTAPNIEPVQVDLSAPTSAADDGFRTATVSGRQASVDSTTIKQQQHQTSASAGPRRHQIPGLRRTPYLKLLLVRCDDTDTYKSQTRSEIKEWVKQNTGQSSSKKSSPTLAENHDAFEWMIVHVVLPNSAAYAQPRTTKPGADGSNPDLSKSTSRWGKSSSTLLERLRSDFNIASSISSNSGGNSKIIIDRVAQIRVGLEDVPYDMLPHIAAPAPATTTTFGYSEPERETQLAWVDLMDKLKSLILASFDVRVSQYEEDIREKDAQRSLPGWNFCTFFILKEGLARGFESVGLVEDALVGYDELSVGLDTVIKERQDARSSSLEAHGSALLSFTEELKKAALRVIQTGSDEGEEEDTVDLQASRSNTQTEQDSDIPISSTKKAYRDLILANNVSVFDFRCYIFARQISLLLRLGNAWSTREELLTRLKEQQESAMSGGTSSSLSSSQLAPPTSNESENLSMLAEICRRTLEFVPAVSQVMREDLMYAITHDKDIGDATSPDALRVIDNMVASFAFSIAQQILAQTSTRALPIPSSAMLSSDTQELKASIPEPKTMMHPARTSSLAVRGQPPHRGGPPSPGIFPGPGQWSSATDEAEKSKFLKVGLEELAARRADLYMLSRNILQKGGEKQGWSDGWSLVPIINDPEPGDDDGLEEVSLDDLTGNVAKEKATVATELTPSKTDAPLNADRTTEGVDNILLRTALESETGFFRLYEVLTDKSLRHYTVAGHINSVNSNLADLAVLKYHLKDYDAATSYFYETTQFFGEHSWSRLELSMLLMHSHCLKELGRNDEYAWRLLKLLTKVAEAEGQQLGHQLSLKPSGSKKNAKTFRYSTVIKGRLGELLEASTRVSTNMRLPLANVFSLVRVEGTPVYAEKQDSFSIILRLDSLLVDALPVDSIKVRMVQQSTRGPPREVWLETKGPTSLDPGNGTVRLHSTTVIPGMYEIDQIRITSKNLVIFHDREVVHAQSRVSTPIFADPHLVLYQRTDAMDVQLSTSRDLQLDKNNFLELTLLTGWNDILSCEMRIRAATGGLRLTTTDSRVVGVSSHTFSKPVENGIVCFEKIAAGTSLTMSFPFSIEQDVLELCVKVEVTYVTKDGSFTFAKAPTVSTSLALGVNVQDVFKHDALFSRFTVSTATASPLQVFKSELLDSDIFTSQFGDNNDIALPIVFPKQPISLLYKILRKSAGSTGGSGRGGGRTTMYIRLHYSVFQDQLDATLRSSLTTAFEAIPALCQFSKLAATCVLRHVHAVLSSHDLERIALLNEIWTAPMLADVSDWAKEFPGLGGTTAAELGGVIAQWLKQNAVVALPQMTFNDATATNMIRTIIIPVDIPSIAIVHTADIRLDGPFGPAVTTDSFRKPPDGVGGNADEQAINVRTLVGSVPLFCVNQLLPATLHLKWTRIWDTGDLGGEAVGESGANIRKVAPQQFDDLEFSFEVSAPTDAWLIGGRRKGHFVIPAPGLGISDGSKSETLSQDIGVGLSSTSDTEATIPLVLIPLREGRLPYPSVDIREVGPNNEGQNSLHSLRLMNDDHLGGGAAAGPVAPHHCETDYRNLGETIHIVTDHKQVTLSLDASGPGGGPLVLESERASLAGRVVV